MDKFKTPVVFRKDKKTGEIEAFLYTDVNKFNGCFACFSHVGQHGDACYAYYVQKTVPATEAEYSNLKKELEGYYGYNLDVRKRIDRKAYFKELREKF